MTDAELMAIADELVEAAHSMTDDELGRLVVELDRRGEADRRNRCAATRTRRHAELVAQAKVAIAKGPDAVAEFVTGGDYRAPQPTKP